MEDVKFYQIRLYSKGVIEIFQNVFWHKINFKTNIMVIHYSSQKNTGSYTVSSISLENVFDVKIIPTPEFEYEVPNPRDKKIIMRGAGKSISYDPEKDEWSDIIN